MKRTKYAVTTMALVIALVSILALSSCGKGAQGVSGNVYDKIYGDKLPFLTLKFTNLDDRSVETTKPNNNGDYNISLTPGKYRFEVLDERTDFKYARYVKGFVIEEGKWLQEDVPADPIVKTFVYGQVLENETNKPIPGASITMGDKTVTTDKEGRYEFKYIRPGNTHLKIEAKGYAAYEIIYNTSEGETIEDFKLTRSSDEGNISIKSLRNILSYRVEIAKGKNKDSISSATKITVNNLPFALDIESPKGAGRYVLSGSYFNKDGKLEKTTEDAFKELKQEYYDYDNIFQSAIDQFHALKIKTSNASPIMLGNYNVSPYAFTVTINNSKYDATFYIVSDGPNKGYPLKLVLSKDGDYKDITVSMINDPTNIIQEPK